MRLATELECRGEVSFPGLRIHGEGRMFLDDAPVPFALAVGVRYSKRHVDPLTAIHADEVLDIVPIGDITGYRDGEFTDFIGERSLKVDEEFLHVLAICLCSDKLSRRNGFENE
jgi:hypothetical protein